MKVNSLTGLRVLRRGDTGSDVRMLQHFLIGEGLLAQPKPGVMDPLTLEGVIKYQTFRCLALRDGIVHAGTWSALLADGLPLVVDFSREKPAPPAGMPTIGVNEERFRRWGRFTCSHNEDGTFHPRFSTEPGPKDWVENTLTLVTCPVFRKAVLFHREVAEDYVNFMEAVCAKGLRHHLLTFDGAHEWRLMRGASSRCTSTNTLSNHAFGVAFDVNRAWNKLGHTPAYMGQKGSVRELVEIGHQFHWFWGGHHKHRREGSHFEHV